MEEKKQYGLFTALSMVIGIVIGSGIFFKSDDILSLTGGNVFYGVLGFLLVGIGVLFGTLVISRYAIDSKGGGLITYFKDRFGHKGGYIIGWFMLVVYFPAISVVLAQVCTIYISQLLNINSTILQIFITFSILAFILVSNILSSSLGGKIQGVATIVKLIPLILIFVYGIFLSDATAVQAVNESANLGEVSFFAALISIAFSFDGWIVATSIRDEIKDSKKNLPRALVFGIIVVICVYILYFVGVTRILPANQIVALGDEHLSVVANIVFGNLGGKLIILFVIISIYGGLNGMILGYLRLPKELEEQKLLKFSNEKENNRITKNAIITTVVLLSSYFCIQLLITYGFIFTNLEHSFDLSSMPITVCYIFYIILYLGVFKIVKNKTIMLYVSVGVAVLTSTIVVLGTLNSNGYLYILISVFIILMGIPFYKSPKESKL